MIDFDLLYFFLFFFGNFKKNLVYLINLYKIYLIILVFYMFFEIYIGTIKKKGSFL